LSASKRPFIRIEGLHYTYRGEPRSQTDAAKTEYALRGINLTINAGEYVAVAGANGSGKSTLLRHLNALLVPASGRVFVSGWDTSNPLNIRNIRSTVGMVFQVPDAQIVATVVEEDVAFGPENLGVVEDELHRRVDWALNLVGLSDLKHRPSHYLSAGQKQLLAIASALSMKPRCLVLDEATSMLDPAARSSVMGIVDRLHREGMTIVSATHNMEEAAMAQRIIVLSEGRLLMEGDPRSLFTREKLIKDLKLDLPGPIRLARRVAEDLHGFPVDTLSVSELVHAIDTCYKEKVKEN